MDRYPRFYRGSVRGGRFGAPRPYYSTGRYASYSETGVYQQQAPGAPIHPRPPATPFPRPNPTPGIPALPAPPRRPPPSATVTREQYYNQEPASDDYYGPAETGDYSQAYEQAYDQGYDYTSYEQNDYQQDPTFDPAFDYDAAPPNLVFGSVAPTPSVTETRYTTPPSVPSRGRPPIRRVPRGSRVSATATRRGDSTSVRGQSYFTTPRRPVQRHPPANTSYQRTPPNVQDNEQQQQQQQEESNYPPVRPRRQTAVQSQQSVTDDSFENQNNGDDGFDENGYEQNIVPPSQPVARRGRISR